MRKSLLLEKRIVKRGNKKKKIKERKRKRKGERRRIGVEGEKKLRLLNFWRN